MNRLIEYTVFSGLVTACRFATCPTSRSSVFVIATTDGVVRPPSWLGITTGSPPCITATTELVVPRSIPIILLMTACPPSIQFCCSGLNLLETRPIQLGSLVPSSARTRVYGLSVSLSSFLIAGATCLFSSYSIPPTPAPNRSIQLLLDIDTSSFTISFRNLQLDLLGHRLGPGRNGALSTLATTLESTLIELLILNNLGLPRINTCKKSMRGRGTTTPPI